MTHPMTTEERLTRLEQILTIRDDGAIEVRCNRLAVLASDGTERIVAEVGDVSAELTVKMSNKDNEQQTAEVTLAAWAEAGSTVEGRAVVASAGVRGAAGDETSFGLDTTLDDCEGRHAWLHVGKDHRLESHTSRVDELARDIMAVMRDEYPDMALGMADRLRSAIEMHQPYAKYHHGG